MSENVKPGNTLGRASSVRLSSILSWPKGRKAKTNNLQRIQSLIEKLDVIYDTIEDHTSPFVNPSAYDNLSIKCEELKLNADGSYTQPVPEPCFFKPLSPNVCRALPINFENMDEYDRGHYDSLNERFERYLQGKEDPRQGLISLCYEMDWEFGSYPRIGTIDDDCKLRSHMGKWRPAEDWSEDAIFRPIFEEALFMSENPSWCPQSFYVPYADSPHIMFSMRHHIDDELVAKDEEHQGELLRGELMAITATMLTRLERFAPEGHIYIPVLIFSFMGNMRGRILQAYFDGTHVAIRKTKLYHFESAEKARELLGGVFLQLIANTPIGDTQEMVNDATKPQRFSQDVPLRQGTSNTFRFR